MKIISVILANLIFIQSAFGGTAISKSQSQGQVKRNYSAVGPGSTGGGEPASQEVRGIISSLPSVLRSTGLQYFPEVKIDDLERRTQGEILVELSPGPIIVDGSPKACHYNQKRNLIQVDPVRWQALSIMPNTEMRKRAMVFHEVLGLMDLEKNNDYTISNRLVAAEFLSIVGIKGSTDQILPTDANDKHVIYWRVSDQGRISFFYCVDRSMVSSCVGLGTRSYTSQDLDTKYRQIYEQMTANEADAKKWEHRSNMWLLTAGGLIVLGLVLPLFVPVLGMLLFVGAGVMVGGQFVHGEATSYRKKVDTLKYELENAKQAAYLKAGVAPRAKFDTVAKGLHQFLLSIDTQTDLAPEAPASVNQKLN